MPELSRFLGITIRMYFDEHAPPHFHAQYGEYEVKVQIEDGKVIGPIPLRVQRLILEWLQLHRHALIDNWKRIERRAPLVPIPPLE